MHLRPDFTKPLVILALLCTLLLVATTAEAARITQVKGKNVLLDLSDGDVQVAVGAKYVMMAGGKRKAIIQIQKVKGTKAIGVVLKGTAEVDGTLVAGKSSSASKKAQVRDDSGDSGEESSDESESANTPGTFIGGLFGYAMDSQSIKEADGSVASMSGSGFSAKGFADIPLSGSIGMIARSGIEQFNVAGNSTTGSASTQIMYLTADLLMRYSFGESGFVPYGAAGAGLHYPLSKSSNILDVAKISATTVFFFGGGFNWFTSSDMFINGTAEYGMFMPGDNVSTSMIAVRAGAGWRF